MGCSPPSPAAPTPVPACPALAHGHLAPLEYHRTLLDDPLRMDAYERALRALVRPGDMVLDLGAGTGILAMLAARRGAARVHAVESMAVAGLAAQLVRANGLSAQVQVHHRDLLELEPIEPVDLVVSDFLGRFVVDDGMLPVVEAAGRWLKPGGRFCPARLELRLAPVGDIQLWAVELFQHPCYGLDLRPALPYALNYCYHSQLGDEALLAPSLLYESFRPPAVPERFDRQLRFRMERPGLLQGLAGWFAAELAPGVLLDTGPGRETHWGQYLFPLPPTPVERGDELSLRLWLSEERGDLVWHWRGSLRGAGGRKLMDFDLESEQRLGEREGMDYAELAGK